MIRIRADKLKVHPLAQRAIVRSRLEKLKATFDAALIGVLHAVPASKAATGIWVVDGQHRLAAMLALGLGDTEVDVQVHVDARDAAAACGLFRGLDDYSPVASFDKFLAGFRAREPSIVGSIQVLRAFQLEVARTSGQGKLVCVRALEHIYSLDKGKTLRLTLEDILAAWGSRAEALHGKILEGYALVLRRNNGQIDRLAMVKKLAGYPGGPGALLGDARGLWSIRRGALAESVAETIINRYNSGRHGASRLKLK